MLMSLTERSGEAAIVVADDGPGIAIAERAQVLHRFYRAERSRHREGSGLGLSLVSAVVLLHGFRLTIGDNHPGCRVELVCPAAPQLDRQLTAAAADGPVRERLESGSGLPILDQSRIVLK